MEMVCSYCHAKKFKSESPGICCKNGKAKLCQLEPPPQELLTYTSDDTSESKHFLSNIRKYNSCFQITSFGATSVVEQLGFPSTFTVQGKIYYKAGSLLLLPDQPPKFLQLYFIENVQIENDQRCSYNSGTRCQIVLNLQRMFHERNGLIKMFKTALEHMPTDEYKVVMRADRRPEGEHEWRCNNPQVNEVAVVISGNEFEQRDIVIQRRGELLQCISEMHRSYDGLQYPVIFPAVKMDIILTRDRSTQEQVKQLAGKFQRPCGNLNPNSPCMKDGKCTKKYPRKLIKETQTGNDSYPLYRRRAPEDGGVMGKLKICSNTEIEIDNSWVVQFSMLQSKMFHAHINLEYCNSVKSIKYVCRYVNKGSYMTVFGIRNEKTNDEVLRYQLGRYISSNEAVWRILGVPIHERHPTVEHLSIHLENGQRVYFTTESSPRMVDQPPNTTLTVFFQLCQQDPFARTLLYPQIPRYYTWKALRKVFCRRKVG
ncbi:uncharacterized protein [Macrobrachium rosenbergii]|uniref:uncharacterized protein n=1 Tax=Macrobrachium rosenbergii TaxID=79674 RepID=UPI0034D4068A